MLNGFSVVFDARALEMSRVGSPLGSQVRRTSVYSEFELVMTTERNGQAMAAPSHVVLTGSSCQIEWS